MREQALDAVGEGRLAAAGLAGEAENLAAFELERDVAHRFDGRLHLVHDVDLIDQRRR